MSSVTNLSDLIPVVTIDHCVHMREALKNFLDNFPQVFNSYDMNSLPDSRAQRELDFFTEAEPLDLMRSAHYMGIHSMESAADHLMAFTDCLEEPAKTVAPFTCVRGLMESCAIAAWLLEPDIEVLERLERSFAFRMEGYEQQKKLLDDPDKHRAIQRSDRMMNLAQGFGFSERKKRDGSILGYGMAWPGITKLVGSTLNEEKAYRILSAVAHGHHWAVMQVSFREKDHPTEKGVKVLEKHFHPASFLYLGQLAVHSMSTSSYYFWDLYGYNRSDLEDDFEELHQKVFEFFI